MVLDEECRGCLYNSQMKKVERTQNDEGKLQQFKAGVKALCENPPKDYCSPLLMRDINRLHARIFGSGIDYSEEKRLFNLKLLSMEGKLYSRIISSPDPISEGVKFAMASNYIDFARMSDLDEGAVALVIQAANRAEPDEKTLESFKNKLKNAKTLCYLHDNCGEIVLDKVLIRVIKELYPQIFVTSVVRGSAVINDVTEEDAAEVGLAEYAEVISNGSDAPGTYLNEVTPQVKRLLAESNVTISKGLGNLETLYDEGVAAFYLFTCKCNHIASRFGAPLWSVVIVENNRR